MAAKKKSTSKKKSTTAKRSLGAAERIAQALDDARALGRKPRRKNPVEAIFDAWNIVLGRNFKGARMVRLLRDFNKEPRWEYGADGDEDARRLQPGSWNRVVRDIASPVYEAAAFAELQYARVRLVFKKPTRFGVVKSTNPPIGTKKEVAAQKKAAVKAVAAAKKALVKQFAETAKTIQADWSERRTLAAGIHKGMQTGVAALCQLEEDRLRDRTDRQVSAKVKARCKAHLRTMASHRRSLARASAEEPVTSDRFPHHLRKWNGARNAIVKTIDGV